MAISLERVTKKCAHTEANLHQYCKLNSNNHVACCMKLGKEVVGLLKRPSASGNPQCLRYQGTSGHLLTTIRAVST